MAAMLRKLGSASVPILRKARAFSSSSSSSSSTAPLLLIPTRNLFSGEVNGKLSDSCYPYCLFSLADLEAGADTKNKKVLLPNEKLLPRDKELLFPDDLRYIGSSHGLVGCVHPRSLKVFLFNPLSPTDSITLLPPLPNLLPRHIEYCKLIMSAPPSDPKCRVLVWNDAANKMCFWTPEDQSWTSLPYRENFYGGTDILYSNRGQCFYLTDGGVFLVAWDLSDPGSPKSSTIRTNYHPHEEDVGPEMYLAESPSSGDLFLVWKSLCGAPTESTDEFDRKWLCNECDIDPNTLRSPRSRLGLSPEHVRHDFAVYKLDLEHSRCDEVHAFSNEDALFLGKNHSFWLSGRDFPTEPNSIYFTENRYFTYFQVSAFDGSRHRVCDMLRHDYGRSYDSTSRYYFRVSKEKSTGLTPIWVLPQSSTASLVERFVSTCQYIPPPDFLI